MTRKEAAEALLNLPEVSRIAVARLQPTDVIVVECDRFLRRDHAELIARSLQDVFPDNKICIMDEGLKLKIVGGAQRRPWKPGDVPGPGADQDSE